jgi:ribose 1,5-bisphosphokinase
MLVAIVGPSGAGKDTLLAVARAELGGTVVFPRRVVTRKASAAEDHESLSESEFAAAVAAGAFAFCWQAHGLAYGIPAAIDDDLRAGRTVVCNVSRNVVGDLRARYACCRVVLVTAPPDVLRARLAARARASDGDILARIARTVATHELAADLVIENVGDPREAARPLLDLLQC